MDTKENIAILFFSRTAYYESRAKRITPLSAEKREKLCSALIAKTKITLESTGLPLYHYHEGKQNGKTFGEKLGNAYQEIFDLGYTSIIAVGNDSPELAKTDWSQIKQILAAGKAVLGPSLRGGTYLIGIPKELFQREKFIRLPWQTNQLFAALEKLYMSPKGQPLLLERIRDINTFFDLKLIFKSAFLESTFLRFIQWLIRAKTALIIKHPLQIITSPILIYSPFRAPPIVQ